MKRQRHTRGERENPPTYWFTPQLPVPEREQPELGAQNCLWVAHLETGTRGLEQVHIHRKLGSGAESEPKLRQG